MISRTNRRGYLENVVEKQHLKPNDLREKAQHLGNNYLVKENIPPYPQPEFHVHHLRHDTDINGLWGIWKDSGFKVPCRGSLQWWSLVVGPDEIRSAEKSLLTTTFPDRMEEQQSFLEKFATSPAFKKASRLGSYRFTFPLKEVLNAYSEQFCSGAQPVMRVLETVLYKQEVMYVVVVHSPAEQEAFSDCPLLTDDDPNAICTYKDGCLIWKAQAMCATHSYELVLRPEEQQMVAQPVCNPQYYVWDKVAVALHVEKKVLHFDSIQLRENLRFCHAQDVVMNGVTFEDFPEADEYVQGLWPDVLSPLEEDELSV